MSFSFTFYNSKKESEIHMAVKSKSSKESTFQSNLKESIMELFPGCEIKKLDTISDQGCPDLLILHKKHWAILECKKSKDAKHQPNQDYYVNKFNSMSYSNFVYPENKEEVLRDLQRTFQS